MNQIEAAKPRIYSDPWYAKNRIAVIERTHKRYANKIQRLTPEELSECQRDPRRVWTIRGPGWIACIEPGCGELHKQLGHHLRVRHRLTASSYKSVLAPNTNVPRYSQNASLLCVELRERLSKKRHKLKLGQRLQKSGAVPPVKKLIASRGKRVMSQQRRLNHADRMQGRAMPALWGKHRGRPLTRRTDDWELAKLAAQDNASGKIAAAIGLKRGDSVHFRLKRIGFLSGVYRHGRPLVGADLRRACDDLTITVEQLADHMGLPRSTIKRYAAQHSVDRVLSSAVGQEFKEAYGKLREQYRHRPQGPKGGRPHVLLPAEQVSIRVEYISLLPAVKSLLKWIEVQRSEEKSIAMDEVLSRVYLEARRGKMRPLALWPYFFDWLQAWKDKSAFLKGALTSSYVVMEFLGKVYAVSADTIRTTRISPVVSE